MGSKILVCFCSVKIYYVKEHILSNTLYSSQKGSWTWSRPRCETA